MTFEERMDEVREASREEGIKEGHLKGVYEESKRIALEMKKDGFSIEQIAKLTKLTREEIESL